jgi:two-component system phosphate regulon sensor histidine kinase PhoR
MKKLNSKLLPYLIAVIIAATIGIQVFWNLEQYKTNKQRYINDVQIALDNSIEGYFSEISKTDLITFLDIDKDTTFSKNRATNFIKNTKATKNITIEQIETTESKENIKKDIISGMRSIKIYPETKIIYGKKALDSLGDLSLFLNKLSLSIARDSIDLTLLDSILNKELSRKQLSIKYQIKEFTKDSLLQQYPIEIGALALSTITKSTLLKPEQEITLLFENASFLIFKRGLAGIFMSVFLAIAIISTLFYLTHIIKKQKQLAEIKNDLISNITHEFKTPITTVATAIEAIRNFNQENDTEKTNNYLNISQQQLVKLNTMVEKLLETATLDSDKLLLTKEKTDLIPLLQNLIQKHELVSPNKKIVFKSSIAALALLVDPFHLENALNNILDNASKYGGDTIEIEINKVLDKVEIRFTDNGKGISKTHSEKIFEKFYRIPTGNRHDVKGFGIGLYYSKKIIEKHGGQVLLQSQPGLTVFKILI